MTRTSTHVRDELHRLLAADLMGPWEGPQETVVGNPRGRYLVGALAPVKISGDGQLSTPKPTLASEPQNVADMRMAEDVVAVATESGSAGVPEAADGEITGADDGDETEDRGPASQLGVGGEKPARGLRARPGAGGNGGDLYRAS